ncbi:MAG TPA: hypothetical protein DDE71_07160 [Tenacibaculum sp.]|nr:hypothetical protein [Tenacibaculum sp.]
MKQELDKIKNLLVHLIDKFDTPQKEVLNIEEVVHLTSLKKSYIYKLNSEGKIPCYSYSEKGKLYFKRAEILEWMTKNKRFYRDDVDDSLDSLLVSN